MHTFRFLCNFSCSYRSFPHCTHHTRQTLPFAHACVSYILYIMCISAKTPPASGTLLWGLRKRIVEHRPFLYGASAFPLWSVGRCSTMRWTMLYRGGLNTARRVALRDTSCCPLRHAAFGFTARRVFQQAHRRVPKSEVLP